jgi:hypothetical protein
MATTEGESLMEYAELLAKVNPNQTTDLLSYMKPYKALYAVLDLHRPISTKKGKTYEVNCMVCIVYRPGGWSNRKYPCPTIEMIEKEI